MNITSLNNLTMSIDCANSNYDEVNTRLIDASKFNNHLQLKEGTPVWEEVASYTGLKLNNKFCFEAVDFPGIPKSSFIYVINANTIGADGLLDFLRWFKGAPTADDHIGVPYDSNINSTDTSIRDQAVACYQNKIRVWDGTGTSIEEAIIAGQWHIVTGVVELLPSKLRQAINDGTFLETVQPVEYHLNTFGDILRLGQLNGTYPTEITDSTINIGEFHFFMDDVSKQDNYAAVIAQLKSKYGIA